MNIYKNIILKIVTTDFKESIFTVKKNNQLSGLILELTNKNKKYIVLFVMMAAALNQLILLIV